MTLESDIKRNIKIAKSSDKILQIFSLTRQRGQYFNTLHSEDLPSIDTLKGLFFYTFGRLLFQAIRLQFNVAKCPAELLKKYTEQFLMILFFI